MATIRARESCGDCYFVTWEQGVNGNRFTQRVTHRHQKLLSTRFYNEYCIILDLGPSLQCVVISFGSSLIVDRFVKNLWFREPESRSSEKKMGEYCKVFWMVIRFWSFHKKNWMPIIEAILNRRTELTTSNHNTIIIAPYLNLKQIAHTCNCCHISMHAS